MLLYSLWFFSTPLSHNTHHSLHTQKWKLIPFGSRKGDCCICFISSGFRLFIDWCVYVYNFIVTYFAILSWVVGTQLVNCAPLLYSVLQIDFLSWINVLLAFYWLNFDLGKAISFFFGVEFYVYTDTLYAGFWQYHLPLVSLWNQMANLGLSSGTKSVKSVNVSFRLPYYTQWGQSLLVCGSEPILGSWDVKKGLLLSPVHEGEELIWYGSVATPTEFSCEYNYYVVDDEKNVLRWEMGKRRKLLLSKEINGGETVQLHDLWQVEFSFWLTFYLLSSCFIHWYLNFDKHIFQIFFLSSLLWESPEKIPLFSFFFLS